MYSLNYTEGEENLNFSLHLGYGSEDAGVTLSCSVDHGKGVLNITHAENARAVDSTGKRCDGNGNYVLYFKVRPSELNAQTTGRSGDIRIWYRNNNQYS